MHPAFLYEINQLFTRRGWIALRSEIQGDHIYTFTLQDGKYNITVIVRLRPSTGGIWVESRNSIELRHMIIFLESFRSLFNTFDGVVFNQNSGVFNFHPLKAPRNTAEIEQAIDLCINATRRYHRALAAAHEAILAAY